MLSTGLLGENVFVSLCLWSFCVHVCVPDHCLTSNIAEIKAQSKCCENKSPRAVTHDHAQDADGAWRHRQVLQNSVCLCMWSLPEVAVCVVVLGGVQVLSWEQACFFALLLLLSHAPGPEYTNTQLYVNSRHLSAGPSCTLKKNYVCFYLLVWLQRKKA